MPAIEAFAKSAMVFDNAVVARGSTLPSYASMLTGLYPFHHGIYNNGPLLHKDLPTLPEMLKKSGYHTAGFVSNLNILYANRVMKCKFCFIFVVFCFTALSIFTVYLRSNCNQMFYKVCSVNVEQSRLKQKLWQKQLQLESLINPAAVAQRLDK